VAERVDFSANAEIYDRRHGSVLALDTARTLALSGSLQPGSRILDLGSGTGRAAVAFADLGYRILALDPALPMLQELRRKDPDIRIDSVCAEGARLPFPARTVDAAILARILYLLPDWHEVLRQVDAVLTPGACLFHEWGNGHAGEPWVQIREKSRTLFQDAGVIAPFHPGARAEEEVDAFLSGLGFVRRKELPIGSGPRMTLQDFICRIVSGELSYIWNVPKPIQQSCLPVLQAWCKASFDLGQPMAIPAELRWTIYRKSRVVASK
jgi:SAM-dependent methyltransferase